MHVLIGLWTWGLIPGRGKRCVFSKTSHSGSETHSAFVYSVGNWGFWSRGKLDGL